MSSAPRPDSPQENGTVMNGARSGPSLERGMSAAQAGRVVVAHYLERMVATEAGTIEGRDPEALHDMRVATRRLRACFRAFRGALANEPLQTLDEEVRWLARLLGHVRDADVFLEWLIGYAARRRARERPALERLIAELRREREPASRQLVSGLRSLRYAALKQALADFVDGSEAGADDATRVAPHAEAAIRRQLRAARRLGEEASACGDNESLHALRIAAKRLRYVCESFVSLFPGVLEPTIAATTAVQDALGAMRDAELQRQRLQAICATTGDEGCAQQLARVARALQRRAYREYGAFEKAYPRLIDRHAIRRLERALATPFGSPGADGRCLGSLVCRERTLALPCGSLDAAIDARKGGLCHL